MQKRILISIIIVCIGIALVAYALTHRDSAAGTLDTFNLSEFGIALDIPSTLADITYVSQDESEKGPGIVLHTFTGTCELGAFYQIQKNAIPKSNTTWTEKTLEQFTAPQGNNPASVKEFTDSYLVFEPRPEPCATEEKEIAEETEQRLALWNSLVSAHYMSQ